MTPPRLTWSADEGRWYLDVPAPVTRGALGRVIAFALPIQKQRYAGLPTGDLKDDLGRAIKALTDGEIRSRVIGRELVAFDTYKSTKTQVEIGVKHG